MLQVKGAFIWLLHQDALFQEIRVWLDCRFQTAHFPRRAPFVAPSLPDPSLPTPPGSQVVEGMDVAWAPDAVSAFEWRVCQAFEVTDSGLQTPILEAFRRS